MRYLLVVLISLFSASCTEGIVVELDKDNVSFKAYILGYGSELENGLFKVNGTLEIHNNSNKIVLFSNNQLFAVVKNEGESRVYKNTPASNTIDFMPVKIEAGGKLKQEVYWALPPVKSLEAEVIELEWRN
ncbi:MAG: hypothetical protein ACMZ63_07945 [Methylotenera sp.]